MQNAAPMNSATPEGYENQRLVSTLEHWPIKACHEGLRVLVNDGIGKSRSTEVSEPVQSQLAALAMSLAKLLFARQNYAEEFDPVWGRLWNLKEHPDVSGPYTKAWLGELNAHNAVRWFLGLSAKERDHTRQYLSK